MKEFNNNELQKITEAIAAFNCYGDISKVDLDDYRIVKTFETTDNFKSSGKWDDLRRNEETGDGWSVDKFYRYQFKPGDTRCDIYVINLDGVRAIIKF